MNSIGHYSHLRSCVLCSAPGGGGGCTLSWLAGGYPNPVLAGGYPSPVLVLGGIPVMGYSQLGLRYTPPTRDLGKNLRLGTPRKDLGPETWERTQDWGTPPPPERTWERTWDWGTPPVNGYTPVKTLPSRIP